MECDIHDVIAGAGKPLSRDDNHDVTMTFIG